MKLSEIRANKHSSHQYKEGPDSTATHNGKEYQLDVLFKLAHDRPPVDVPIDKLKWVLPYADIDFDRLMKADVSVPVLVYNDRKYGLTVIDGAHRLSKAVMRDLPSIPAIILSDSDMKQALIPKKP
jgi:hypothetical protein